MPIRKALAVLAVCAAVLTQTAETSATPITLTFDTASLTAAGVYSLDFQLNSSENPTGNSATLTNFQFGGGAVLGTSFYAPSGGYSGSVSTPPLVLTVVDSFNSFTQDFTPGTFLSFTLDLTNIAPSGLIPDQFSFAILLDGLEVITTDAVGANKLFRADLNGDPSGPTASQYDPATAVPEPGTLTLVGIGLLGTCILARRRGRISMP